MADLVALGVQTPQINTAANFQASQNNAINQAGALQQQHQAALEHIASISLGVLGGDPNGNPDPQRLATMKTLLASGGNNPETAQFIKMLDADPKGTLQGAINMSLQALQMGMAQRQFALTSQVDQSTINKNNAEAAMMANGGQLIGGQPMVGSDGSVSYPTQFGGMRQVVGPNGQPMGTQPAPSTQAPPGVPATPIGAPDSGLAPSVAGSGAATPASAAPHILTPAEMEAQKTLATKTAEIKAGLPEKMVAAKTSLDQLAQSDKLVSTFIDQAIQEADGLAATGWPGAKTKILEGTPAFNLAKTLDTVRANVGFDKLNAMRAASPSGGALGQVSNFEEQLLQSVLGSLDQGQSKAKLIANLNRLKEFISSNNAQRQSAFDADYGGVIPLSGDPSFNPANQPGSPSSAPVTSKPVDMGNGVTIEPLGGQ